MPNNIFTSASVHRKDGPVPVKANIFVPDKTSAIPGMQKQVAEVGDKIPVSEAIKIGVLTRKEAIAAGYVKPAKKKTAAKAKPKTAKKTKADSRQVATVVSDEISEV